MEGNAVGSRESARRLGGATGPGALRLFACAVAPSLFATEVRGFPNSFFGKCAAGFRSSAVPAPPLLNPTHWPRSRVPWLGTGFGDSRVNEVTRRGHSLGWTGCSVTVDVKHHLGVCPAKPNLQSSTNKAMLCDADERQGGDSP